MAIGAVVALWSVSVKLTGTAYDDTFYVNSNLSCTLLGNAGNDTLTAESGNHYLSGGIGDDQITALHGWSTLLGGDGNDTLVMAYGGGLADAGLGNDTIYAHHASAKLIAGDGDDKVFASDGNFRIEGGLGADQINANRGNNDIRAGAGNDTIVASAGNNGIYGDAGDDRITVSWGNNAVYGGVGNDTIFASTGNNLLDCGAGNDQVTCYNGEALVLGGAGVDTIRVLAGNSTIDGGLGADVMVAGYDCQTFRYTVFDGAADRIDNFRSGADKFAISAALLGGGAIGQMAAGLLAFNAPNAAHGQFVFNTTTGRLGWDADGSGAGLSKTVATLTGVHSLQAKDFFLIG